MLFKVKKQSKFNFVEEGEGHPLVLLHGLMGGLSNFDGLMKFFSQNGYKVYAPELPIYSLPLISTNVSHIAKFVGKFLNEVVKEPASLIGNSLGGHVALITALKHPDLVHSICLTGSSGLYEKSFGESYPKKGDYEYVKRKTEEVFYHPEVATKAIVDEVFETVNDRKKAIKTLYIARSAIKHNLKDDLKDLHQPVCLIWGENDMVTPPEVAIDFEKGLPNASLFWMKQCGHAPMMEYPDKFNEILFAWYQAQKIGGKA